MCVLYWRDYVVFYRASVPCPREGQGPQLQVVGFLIILNTVMVHVVFIRAKIPLGKTKTAG